MNASAPAPEARPWHREPWVWLIIAIPLVTVVGGFVTLGLAIQTRDELVTDDFRKEGVAIYADPRRDAAAAQLGVSAELAVDRAGGRINATLDMPRGEAPPELLLVLSHATRAEYDHMVVLRRSEDGYTGRLDRFESGRWYLELTPRSRAWRLKGVLEPEKDGVLRLEPAVP
ncbi:MAG: FixH family protein [Steroidobacteraceae bacterium]|jgi:hypothetical protein|nr:FixH family protein [Steroidobacteraceae bacterium]